MASSCSPSCTNNTRASFGTFLSGEASCHLSRISPFIRGTFRFLHGIEKKRGDEKVKDIYLRNCHCALVVPRLTRPLGAKRCDVGLSGGKSYLYHEWKNGRVV